MTEKQRKMTALLTVIGIIFAVIISVALIYNIVTLTNESARAAKYNKTVAELEAAVTANDELLDYYNDPSYIENAVRDKLGMSRPHEIIYETEDE